LIGWSDFMTITLEIAAIILSIVSFIVTVLGFFASLRFYRDGVELQKAANDALTRITEKTDAIQSQVGGMFDKTLNAALGQRYELSASFEELDKQVTEAKEALLNEVRGQIGEVGEQQQQRVKQIVEEQIRLLQEKVESTRESAEEIAKSSLKQHPDVLPLDIGILKALASTDSPLNLRELGRYLELYNLSLKNISLTRQMKKLSRAGFIIPITQGEEVKYFLTVLGKEFITRELGLNGDKSA
jgi:hypothetical protein